MIKAQHQLVSTANLNTLVSLTAAKKTERHQLIIEDMKDIRHDWMENQRAPEKNDRILVLGQKKVTMTRSSDTFILKYLV